MANKSSSSWHLDLFLVNAILLNDFKPRFVKTTHWLLFTLTPLRNLTCTQCTVINRALSALSIVCVEHVMPTGNYTRKLNCKTKPGKQDIYRIGENRVKYMTRQVIKRNRVLGQKIGFNQTKSGELTTMVPKKISKYLPQYKHIHLKTYYGPIQPPGDTILTYLLLYYAREISCKYQLFCPSGSSKHFKNIFPTWTHVKTASPILPPPKFQLL
jgi:hypothetical protein